ncbi:Ankyrin repeats domain-containing protein [Phytophthora infestans]|uniref:Ankyrin repeats domain-containing protein n=1 Tax=Phytophthora infestans TaxID=4787 RepID=A0A8S9UD66_PHYIN|nr:Ankyrin repeats domain-containing protein [Phytophthora infestans]KAF4143842.1 Ankyrin repeats domain-containing protein [Phytophthora infestans]
MSSKHPHESGDERAQATPLTDDAGGRSNVCRTKDGATPQTKSVSSHGFERLKEASFPCAITSLPHVLSLIDTLIMSPEEAAIEAARIGQLIWLNEIKHRFKKCDLRDAFVGAAGSGHVDIVVRLYIYVDPYKVRGAVGKVVNAITRAATNGHLNVIQFLLPKTANRATYEGLIPALDAAAEKGHLGIVKFMVNHAKLKCYHNWVLGRFRLVDALSCAISSKQTEVVEYLFSLSGSEFHWNFKAAVMAAAHAEQKYLLRRIYELYATTTFCETNMFVDLARDDLYLRGVIYLYENGWDDMILLSDAFVAAASGGAVKTLQVFLNTGRISQGLFDKAFETVFESEGAVDFLYSKKRASASAINRAFTLTKSLSRIRFLLENEQISDDTISAAFSKACKAKRIYTNRNRMYILRYLGKLDCIPPEVFDDAFAYAAKYSDSEIMDFLRGDERLSPDVAFLNAAVHGQSKMMESVYDVKKISPETILTAYTKCAGFGCIYIPQRLLWFMREKHHVPQTIRFRAFVQAAKVGCWWALKELNASEDGNLPLFSMKKALVAARDDTTKNYIRKIICEQLFDRKVECGCGCGNVIHRIE